MRATVAGSSGLAATGTISNLFYSLRVDLLVGGAAGRRGSFDSYIKITIWFDFICTLLYHMLLFWKNLVSVLANKGRGPTTYVGIVEHIAL